MKIVRTEKTPEQTTLLDVALGEVFECTAMWPGKVFIRVWSNQSRKIKFADISGDAGHTYTYSPESIKRNIDGQDYGVSIYRDAIVNLGEPG